VLHLLTGKIDTPFTCPNFGTCTSLRRESIGYVGCCYAEGDCDIYTGCYDGEAPVGARTTNPRILSCVISDGTRPFCATVLWPQESKAAFLCAKQPSTVTVDSTTNSASPTTDFTSESPRATEAPSEPVEPSGAEPTETSQPKEGPRPLVG
jgi:hypothetical protein